MKKTSVLILIILALLIGFMVWRFINISKKDAIVVIGEGSVEVVDQKPGQLGTTIKEVRLAQNGFVVIKGVVNGNAGVTVGVSKLLRAGVHKNVQVLMELVPGQEYAVFLYADNGNGVFDDLDDVLIEESEAHFFVDEDEAFFGK
ncbi:MAG: hypothetical protein R3B52_00715 [Candidatus Paceibacterota bacterium]